MATEIALSLNNVSKCYKRYARPVERLKEILLPGKSTAEEFWALQDINLKVFKGETLGIIGQNGSGKSTLLQIIARTLMPTTGNIQVNGRVSALLELGSGFNPEFTGRQNVFFNGQILGLTQEEIAAKFDEILEFADIGNFIDEPVKTYSSGMFVRLAFAVAVSVNPDILIIDEALAVGDIYFQQKCFSRIKELKNLGTTLLFVSHDSGAVYKLCSRAVLIEAGKIILEAEPKQVIDLYQAKLLQKNDDQPESVTINIQSSEQVDEYVEETIHLSNNHVVVDQVVASSSVNNNGAVVVNSSLVDNHIEKSVNNNGKEVVVNSSLVNNVEEIVVDSSEVKIKFVRFLDDNGQEIESVVISGHSLQLCIGLLFLHSFEDPHIGFKIRDRTGEVIFETNTFCMHQKLNQVTQGTFWEIRFKFNVPIREGEYTITVGVADSGWGEGLFKRTLLYTHNAAALKVLKNKDTILWAGIVNLDPSVTVYKHTYV